MRRGVWLQATLALVLFLAGGPLGVRGAPPSPADSGAEPQSVVTPAPGVRVRFEGPIQALPAARLGTWTVGGVQVQVVAETALAPTGIEPQVGDRASVLGVYLQGGQIQATHVTVTKADQYQPELVEFSGLIQALPPATVGVWTVNAIPVHVSESTTLLPAGVQPHVGDLARVRAQRQVDGRLVAQTIQVESVVAGWTPVQFEGRIEECPPAEPYLGHWLIAGVHLEVTDAQTVVGEPATGLAAEVEALSGPTSSLTVQRIRVLPANVTLVDLEGAIQSLPAGSPLGTWIVGGREITVTASTLIDESRAATRVGAWAVVRAQRVDGGPLQALRIRVERPREDNPAIEFSGLIQDLPDSLWIGTWIVHGIAVEVDRTTRIEGVPTENRGAVARVNGDQLADGRVKAHRIVVSYPWAAEQVLQGTIDSIPDTFFGSWRVSRDASGQRAWVTVWASITGAPEPGRQVTVRGVRVHEVPGEPGASNVILAFSVEVPGPAETTEITGTVTSAPYWMLGEWQVGRTTVYVNAATEIVGNPRKNSQVRVSGTRVHAGSRPAEDRSQLLAQRIEELGTAD